MSYYIYLLFSIFFIFTHQQLYNHNSGNSYRNQSWMGKLDNGITLRKLSILGTHSSMSQGTWGDAFQTQSLNIDTQLRTGVRALDIRCRHKNDRFFIHQRLVYLNVNFADVLNQIQSFLVSFPTQTILVHVVQQYNPTGNTRSFEDTYIWYRDQFASLIWNPTHQNPNLGQTRGKIVIIQDFSGSIHGLLMTTFTVLPHKIFNTNWDQYDKWTATKSFLTSTSTAGSSSIAFWTGSTGSFPYFVASGKSSPSNGAPRLATGLTTPGFKSYYPDFPRVACIIGICTIAFEGINILGYNYIVNQGYQFLGIIYTDFFGDSIASKMIDINLQFFGKCTSTQVAQGCTVCSKSGDCLQCDTTLHYVYNSVSKLCDAEIGYYLNSSSIPTLCSTSMIGCLECSSQTVCTLCDTFAHYVLRVSNQCQAQIGYYLDSNSIPNLCSLAIIGCQQCSSGSVCTQCSTINNFISIGDICQCDGLNNFVITPNNQSCVCNTGYFMNTTVTPSVCDPMPLCPDPGSGCLDCQSFTCLVCDTANNFILSSPYCYCDISYYYNGASCDLCNLTLGNQCATCASDILCLSCIDNFTLKAGQCQCLPQFYVFDSDTCLSCPIGCLDCTSDTVCTKCDTDNFFEFVGTLCQCQKGMFLDLQTSSCQLCTSMAGCIDCNMAGCLQCDLIFGFTLDSNTSTCICNPDSFINQMNVCQKCPQTGCLQCTSRTICTLCDTTLYYLSNDNCYDICGDGKAIFLQCDDGNLIDGDGCSSVCTVQDYFECSGGSQSSPSACSFSGQINMKLQDYQKDPLKNQITAVLSLEPNLPVLKNLNFSETIQTTFSYDGLLATFDPTTGLLTVIISYTESLNARDDLQVSINPPSTPQFLHTPTSTIKFLGTTFNNLALLHYDNTIYQSQPILQTIITVLAILSLLVFAIGFFISKLIAIQFISIFQLAFLGLLMLQRIQAYFIPAKKLWITHGYNIFLQQSLISGFPYKISSIGYKSAFISNFNIMAVLILIPLIIGLVLFIYSKVLLSREIALLPLPQKQAKKELIQENKQQIKISIQDSPFLKKPIQKESSYQNNSENSSQKSKTQEQPLYKSIRRWAFIFFKQYEISFLLFISYQLIVSLGIGFLFNADFSIAFGVLILLGFIFLTVIFYIKPLNFGQYKNFFHQTNLCQNYYIILIILRIIIGFSIILPNSSSISVCLVLAFCVIQFLLNIIIRPYLSNIRPILNSIILIIIFSIFSVYGLNLVSNPQWTTTNLPIFIYALLFFCLIYNVIFLILHLHQICKKKTTQRQYEEEMEKTKQILYQLRDRNGLGVENKSIIATPKEDNQKSIMMTPTGDNFVNPHKQIIEQLKKQMQNYKQLKQQNFNQLYEEI